MRQLILATLMAVGLCSTAQAQSTLPDLQRTYVVATTTAELYKVRAAMTKLSNVNGVPVCPDPEEWSAPFEGDDCMFPPIDDIPGFGESGCMISFENDIDFQSGVFGETTEIDGEPVSIPEREELATQDEIPAGCYAALVEWYCWGFGHEFPEWAAWLCPDP